eukprot:792751-Prymnesium_polylepis.1
MAQDARGASPSRLESFRTLNCVRFQARSSHGGVSRGRSLVNPNAPSSRVLRTTASITRAVPTSSGQPYRGVGRMTARETSAVSAGCTELYSTRTEASTC